MLTNPALNYVQFLLRAILPTVLHVVIAIAAGYAVGSEFGRRRLSAMAGDGAAASPLTALVGKLAALSRHLPAADGGRLGIISRRCSACRSAAIRC